MKLEQLVPPFSLCCKIPQGAFADSALVWAADACMPAAEVVLRECARRDDLAIPAPTLDELLAAIKSRTSNHQPSIYWEETPDVYGWRCRVWRRYARSYKNFLVDEGDDDSPVVAAMKVYLALLPKRRLKKPTKEVK